MVEVSSQIQSVLSADLSHAGKKTEDCKNCCEAEEKAERGRGTSAGNSAVTGSRSANVMNTKNEPVVGRNIFHRARPWQGAKLTPWLWAGGTKEVRTSTEMCRDPGRHGRCAAIDGWVYTRPCKTEK